MKASETLSPKERAKLARSYIEKLLVKTPVPPEQLEKLKEKEKKQESC